MGMFDTVKFEAKCHYCNTMLTDWQSKSGPRMLAKLNPHEVDNFYTMCHNCKKWNEYIVKAEVETIVKNLELTFKPDQNDIKGDK